MYLCLNTASASKVGQFRPFLGEVKKLKGPLMSIFLFKYRNVEVQLLRQHWMHSFYLLDATNAAI